MIRTILLIIMGRELTGDPEYIRCGECGAVWEPSHGSPSVLSTTRLVNGQVVEHTQTPKEVTCPACGR